MTEPADFYTGFVADAYAALKGETFDAKRYADFVRRSGEPGLEVGCGDGHPLLDLVEAGLDVDGVDSSPDMIARAHRAAHRRGLAPGLHLARMEEIDLRRQYRSLYLAGPTFTLLPDDAAAAKALRAFRRHLHPDGTAMVPLWIPGHTPVEQLGATREATDASGTVLSFVAVAEDYDPASRVRRTQVRYTRSVPGSATETIERDWIIHWQTPETITDLAGQAGLVVDRIEPTSARGELPTGAEFTAYLTHAGAGGT